MLVVREDLGTAKALELDRVGHTRTEESLRERRGRAHGGVLHAVDDEAVATNAHAREREGSKRSAFPVGM